MKGISSQSVILLFANAIMVFLSMAFWLWPLPELAHETQHKPDPIIAAPSVMASEVQDVPARSFFRPFVPDVPAEATEEPEPPAMPVPAEPQEAPRPLRLVGVIDQGSASIAFLLVEGHPGILRRVVGEYIEGWFITSIGRRTIELRRDHETTLLALDPKVEP